MSQQLRRTALLAATAAALLGLTACSSTTTAAHPANASAPAGTATAAPSPAAAGGLPTGTKLNALLLPASALPAKFTLDAAGSRSTADDFNPPAAPTAVPADKACDMLSGTAWVNVAGIGSASFAQNDYTDPAQDMFAQELDAYRGQDAQAVMASLKKVLTACHTFTATENGQSYQASVALKELPGVGDEALQAVITSPSWEGGSTLVAARVGSTVVTTYDADRATAGAAGVALTRTLVGKVAAAH